MTRLETDPVCHRPLPGQRAARSAATRALAATGLAMLLCIAACTHKPVHPTKTEREWAADHKACEKWAREEIRPAPDTYDDLDEMKMIKSCMRQKGWRWERADWFRFRKEPAE